MVRILKVRDLEERKRMLLARSEMYRQTLKLEVANIKFSAALLNRKLKLLRTASRLLGLAVPLAGMYFFRRKPESSNVTNNERNGILSRLIYGFKLFGQLSPLLRGFRVERQPQPKRKSFMQFFS